jgi:hypothetical protein
METSPQTTIVCDTEGQARAEAEKRERDDPERGRYVWRWLRLDGQWVAKRYARDEPEMPKPKKTLRVVIDAILDGLGSSGH